MSSRITARQPVNAAEKSTAEPQPLIIAGCSVELQIMAAGDRTLRVSLVPLDAVGAELPVGDAPELEPHLPLKPLRVCGAFRRTSISFGPTSMCGLPQIHSPSRSSAAMVNLFRRSGWLADGSAEVEYGDTPVFGLGQAARS